MTSTAIDKAFVSLMTMHGKGLEVSRDDVQRTAAWFGAEYRLVMARFNAASRGAPYRAGKQ